MDDLSGLLVEGFGFRPRDRAPMAASKARAAPTQSPATSAPAKPPPPPKRSPPPSDHDLGDLDTFFAPRPPASSDDLLFGGFPGVGSNSAGANDDIFGSFPSAGADSSADLLGDFGVVAGGRGNGFSGGSAGANASADLLGGFASGTVGEEGIGSQHGGSAAGNSAPTATGADLLGDFGDGSSGEGMGSGGGSGGEAAGGLNELMSGFGGSGPPRVPGASHDESSVHDKSAANMPKDPFIDLEYTGVTSQSPSSFTPDFDEFDILSGPVKSDKKSTSASADDNVFNASQGSSSLFATDAKISSKPCRVEERRDVKPPTGLNGFDGSPDVDFLFSETKMESDPLVDLLTKQTNSKKPASMKSEKQERNSVRHADSADNIWSSVPSSNIRKTSSSPNIVDDWNSLFGAPPSEEFQEIEGEPEERRKARYERHQRTLERAVRALNEKNERDMQIERENAERHRIAERLDADIKRWAAGKEGNLRALLSSLQHVLWPECAWQPVAITDLITSASVKKVYRKATLCIHPDKVQQKGANLQQKYTAEKVFDLLKEAWKKFNMEELS